MLLTDEYRATLAQTHETHAGWGATTGKHLQTVLTLIDSIDAESVLDYGCGKGGLMREVRKVRPALWLHGYDPAVPPFCLRPLFRRYDLLVSFDVLEHVEPECLDDVLADMSALGKHVHVDIATTLAVKVLPDGRNAHLIVEPYAWWKERLPANHVLVATLPSHIVVQWTT